MTLCALCDTPIDLEEGAMILNNQSVHVECYDAWSEHQAYLRQKEEDEL